jgi:uncharacterized protein (UPF0332 family)
VTPHAASRWAKAERFLDQTTRLSPVDVPEATIHSAYYTMLHAAAAVLLDRTGQTPKRHAALIGQFCLLVQGNEQGRLLGRAFNLAEEIRLIADYDDRKIPTAKDATELQATAVDFVAYCRSLL